MLGFRDWSYDTLSTHKVRRSSRQNSGRETVIVVAQDDKSGLKIAHPVIDALREEMIVKQIDVLMIDPFVSSHGVSENDNVKINAVLRQWGMLSATATNWRN